MPVEYQVAIERLADGLAAVLDPDVAAAEAASPDLLAASQEVENAAAAHLASGDWDVRELAAQQLLVGAIADLAAAEELLRAEGVIDEPALGEDERSFGSFTRSFADIIQADPAMGIRAIYPPGESAVLAEVDLATVAEETVNSIADDAASMANHAVSGVVGLGPEAISGGLGKAADQWLTPVYDAVRGRVRWALKLVGKAVSKLLRLLGPLEPMARKWLREKLEGIGQEQIVQFAVNGLLGVAGVREEVLAHIRSGPSDTDLSGMKAGELEALSKRFGRYETIVDVAAKILAKVRGVLLALAGWVAAALAGLYGLLLLVAIWVAGDYLDWQRVEVGGSLDLVHGVRSIVADVAPAAP